MLSRQGQPPSCLHISAFIRRIAAAGGSQRYFLFWETAALKQQLWKRFGMVRERAVIYFSYRVRVEQFYVWTERYAATSERPFPKGFNHNNHLTNIILSSSELAECRLHYNHCQTSGNAVMWYTLDEHWVGHQHYQ